MKRIVFGLAVCICGSGCIILDDTWEPAVVVHDPAPAPVVVTVPDYGYDWYRGQWVPHYDGWYYYNNSWCWGRSDRKAPHRPPHWKPDKRRQAPPPRYDHKHPAPKKPAVKPAPKPALKPAPKPVVKPAPKPAVKPAPKPAAKPAAKRNAPKSFTPAPKKTQVKPAARPATERKQNLQHSFQAQKPLQPQPGARKR